MSLEDLKENVGLYRCGRCWKKKEVHELIEDEASPGLPVCKECFERKGFNEVKGENPKDKYSHYFAS